MTTSVRIDGNMFVVRINGCQHKISEEQASKLIEQLCETYEDFLVIQHCADDA